MPSDDRKGVFVPLWAMEDTEGEARDAMVLAQISWWLQPSQREGRRRVPCIMERDGFEWLYMTDAELGVDIGLSHDQVCRARKALKKRGLIESQSRVVDKVKVTMVRIVAHEGGYTDQNAVVRNGVGGALRRSALTKTQNCVDQNAELRNGTSLIEIDQKKRPTTTEPLSTASTDVDAPEPPPQQVFNAWVEATGKARATMDAKRKRLIENALKLYPLEDVLAAVRGWKNSPWHCGQNDRNLVYNGLDLLLRDAEHIERFRDLALQGPPRRSDPRSMLATDRSQPHKVITVQEIYEMRKARNGTN